MPEAVNGGQSIGLFFIYGFRGTQGPFYVAGAGSPEEAARRARDARARWSRTIAKDVRTGAVVFDSAND